MMPAACLVSDPMAEIQVAEIDRETRQVRT
jgi:hypothetical protein